jgi:hypothetical protein
MAAAVAEARAVAPFPDATAVDAAVAAEMTVDVEAATAVAPTCHVVPDMSLCFAPGERQCRKD